MNDKLKEITERLKRRNDERNANFKGPVHIKPSAKSKAIEQKKSEKLPQKSIAWPETDEEKRKYQKQFKRAWND